MTHRQPSETPLLTPRLEFSARTSAASTQEAGAAMVDLLGRGSGINHRDL